MVAPTLTTGEQQMKLLLPGAVTTNCCYIFSLSTCYRQLQRYNIVYNLKKLDFKTQGSTEFITLRSLVAPSLRSGTTAQGLQVINSVDPCVLKSNYYL